VLNNADYQRDLSRTLAKNNMGGGRRISSVLQSGLAARHAGRNQKRRLQFEGIALNKRASDNAANHSQRLLNMKSKNLKNEKKMMGLQTWLGIGGMGLNFMEGRRRKGLMAQDRVAQGRRDQVAVDGLEQQILSNMRPSPSGSYYKGGY